METCKEPKTEQAASSPVETIVNCTDNGKEPERTWGCGWAKSTERCLRFHCKNNEPCGGYQEK